MKKLISLKKTLQDDIKNLNAEKKAASDLVEQKEDALSSKRKELERIEDKLKDLSVRLKDFSKEASKNEEKSQFEMAANSHESYNMWDHQKYKWLKSENIKYITKECRVALYIPEDFLKNKNEFWRYYWNTKALQFNHVFIFQDLKGNSHFFHNDAVIANNVVGLEFCKESIAHCEFETERTVDVIRSLIDCGYDKIVIFEEDVKNHPEKSVNLKIEASGKEAEPSTSTIRERKKEDGKEKEVKEKENIVPTGSAFRKKNFSVVKCSSCGGIWATILNPKEFLIDHKKSCNVK